MADHADGGVALIPSILIVVHVAAGADFYRHCI